MNQQQTYMMRAFTTSSMIGVRKQNPHLGQHTLPRKKKIVCYKKGRCGTYYPTMTSQQQKNYYAKSIIPRIASLFKKNSHGWHYLSIHIFQESVTCDVTIFFWVFNLMILIGNSDLDGVVGT
jgi:hypothetical protein